MHIKLFYRIKNKDAPVIVRCIVTDINIIIAVLILQPIFPFTEYSINVKV